MKKRIVSTWIALCMVLAMLPVSALAAETPDFTVIESNITYGYKIQTGTKNVELVSVSLGNFNTSPEIPETVKNGGETYTVTGIASDAFSGQSELSTITIPESVTEIKANTFKDMTQLRSVTLPDTITSIGNSAFEGCTTLSLSKLPASLQTIGTKAFYDCDGFRNIEIPAGVTEIPAGAFGSLQWVSSVALPEGLVTIGESAFAGVGSSTSCGALVLPSTLKSIGMYAFQYSGFTSVSIPDGIQSIGKEAFSGSEYLRGDIVLPQTLQDLGYRAFYNCPLEDITLYNNVDVELPYATTKSEVFTMESGSYHGTFTLLKASSAQYDGWYEAIGPANFENVVIGEGIKVLSTGVFSECNIDRELTLPSTLEHVYSSAFTGSNGPWSISIPENAGDLAGGAFSYTDNPVIYLNDVFLSNMPSVGGSGPFPEGSTVYVSSTTMLNYYTTTEPWASIGYNFRYSPPEDKKIEVPEANTGLVYSGELQVGVPEGTGYTLTNHEKTEVGNYSATATLLEGYAWKDGSTGSKSISWKIDKYTYTDPVETTENIRIGTSGELKVNIGLLLQQIKGPGTPGQTRFSYAGGKTDPDNILGTPSLYGTTLTIPYNAAESVGKTASVPVTIIPTNYNEITATITVTTVDKSVLPAASIVCGDMTVTYDGEAHAIGDASITGDYTGGAFTVTYLYTGDSYSSADAPTDAGVYTVTITAENADYAGTATAKLTIDPKPLTDGMLTIAGVTYNGQPQTPVLTVEDGEVPLVKDTDYTVTLAAQTDAGAYPVSITGTGNYSGTATADFVIAPKDIQGAVVTLERAGYVYTGQPIEPVVTSVTVDTLSLTAADYTVSYADNTAIGTGTVIITAKDGGNYTGSAEKSFAITESEYYFAVTAPGTMVVGQTADASVTLEGVDSAQPYDHALIKVSVTGPEGAAPQIMAMDTTGGEHNLAVTGQWGPDTGFQVTGGHSATTPLKLTFDLPGTYTAEFQLVDLDTQEVLGSGTCSIEVGDAYSFVITAPDTMRPNQTAEASATLKGDANAPTYAHALIKITVEAPDGANPKVMAIDSNDVEYNLAEIGQWGPDTGFQVAANYNVTTELKLTFDKNGTYKATFQLVDVDTGKVLGSGEKTITVRTPSSGGGGSVSYAVAVSGSSHGDVKVSPSRASAGSLVTITVTPDEGYVLADLTVTDKSGKEIKVTEKSGGKYTFTMPSSQVTVEAEFVPEDGALPFGDVAESSWYYDAVRYAYDNGLINGVSDTAFAPASKLTRGMLVTLLYRMEKEPAAKGGNVFSDVEADSWYADAVAWSAANGLVEGYEDGAFRPDNAITREQMALILYRYAALKGYDTDAKGDMSVFADGEQVSPWAAEAMTWAVGEQLLSGKGNGVLDPTGTATRAEVAQILMNFCENIAK